MHLEPRYSRQHAVCALRRCAALIFYNVMSCDATCDDSESRWIHKRCLMTRDDAAASAFCLSQNFYETFLPYGSLLCGQPSCNWRICGFCVSRNGHSASHHSTSMVLGAPFTASPDWLVPCVRSEPLRDLYSVCALEVREPSERLRLFLCYASG